MNYEAVLFDMDGVIIDSEAAVTEFWNVLARRYAVELTVADFDRHIYGCPSLQTLDALFPKLTAAEREAVLVEEKRSETDMHYVPMDGVVEVLRGLRANGIATALVTSGEQWKVDEVTRQLGIGELFGTCVTANDVVVGKPNPACYRLAAERLGVAPERCIVFEDSISGAQAGFGAGACLVGVRPARTASALLAEGACDVIADFTAVSLEVGDGIILKLAGVQGASLRLG